MNTTNNNEKQEDDAKMDSSNIKLLIYELYINLKNSFSKLELNKLSNGTEPDINSSTETSILLNYLKSYINFLIQEKTLYSKNDFDNNNSEIISSIEIIRQLESYIRKLEDDIKYLIKTHYQNKILRDSLETKLRAYMQIEDDYEKLKEKVRYEEGKFMENDRKDNEINILRRENSNVKKEVLKLKKQLEKLNEIEEKNQELEAKHHNDEEIIKKLNIKIDNLNSKISDLKEELTNAKNENNEENTKNNLLININDKNINNNFSTTKISFNKYKVHLDKSNSKSNYKIPFSVFNSEYNYKKNKSRTNKIIENYIHKYTVNTEDKIYTSKNVITPIRSDIYKSIRNTKNDSISLRAEEKGNKELINKFLKNDYNHNNNKVIVKNEKSRSLKNVNKKSTGHKFYLANNSINKRFIKDSKSNKNIMYEHSALNVFGINKKFKI